MIIYETAKHDGDVMFQL